MSYYFELLCACVSVPEHELGTYEAMQENNDRCLRVYEYLVSY